MGTCRDEEPILVTYLVPNLKQWRIWLDERGLREEAEDDESMSGLLKRFQALRCDLRDHLKTKLPTYAVPTFFLPLRRMPLNPNGKIDKPALPFPNMAEITAASVREPPVNGEVSFSDTEKTIAEIWAKVIPNTTEDVGHLPIWWIVMLNLPRPSDQRILSLILVAIPSVRNIC